MIMDGYCTVLITASSSEEAATIARALVDKMLAACVSIIPGVRSVFRWQGNISEEEEHLLIAKSKVEQFNAIEKLARELHSYDVPEIICIPIVAGSEPYLHWIKESVSESGRNSQ
jgi:periplasmic divalent cation tolerance protein